MAEYLEGEPQRNQDRAAAQKAKLAALERKLGISADGTGKQKAEDEPSGSKRRFDDTEYLEQTRDIVDNVKSAVAAGTCCWFLPHLLVY